MKNTEKIVEQNLLNLILPKQMNTYHIISLRTLFACHIYLHFLPASCDTCSIIGGKTVCRFAIESLASKHTKTTVFCSEFG